MAVLIDTSAMVAALDRADPEHDRVVAALGAERAPILVPVVTLPEVAYLVGARHGAARAAAVLTRIAHGPWPIVGLEGADLTRATELMSRYADSEIGFVDSALVALAERLGVVRVYTLDRRDFAMVRPRHVEAFEVLPGLT
jgi:predicted nucleic acid-binding protein